MHRAAGRLRAPTDRSSSVGWKEQICLFAGWLSTDEMKGNQLRLYFSAPAGSERQLVDRGAGGYDSP